MVLRQREPPPEPNCENCHRFLSSTRLTCGLFRAIRPGASSGEHCPLAKHACSPGSKPWIWQQASFAAFQLSIRKVWVPIAKGPRHVITNTATDGSSPCATVPDQWLQAAKPNSASGPGRRELRSPRWSGSRHRMARPAEARALRAQRAHPLAAADPPDRRQHPRVRLHQSGARSTTTASSSPAMAASRRRSCLGMTEVPTVCLSHMSEAEKRAYVIADNRLAEKAGWDDEILAIEFQTLFEIDPELDLDHHRLRDRRDRSPYRRGTSRAPSRTRSTRWRCRSRNAVAVDAPGRSVAARTASRAVRRRHARPASYDSPARGRAAQMVFTDPPYNVAHRRPRQRPRPRSSIASSPWPRAR